MATLNEFYEVCWFHISIRMLFLLLFKALLFKLILACPASRRKIAGPTVISAKWIFTQISEDKFCSQKPYHSWCLKDLGKDCDKFEIVKEHTIKDKKTKNFIVKQHNDYRRQVAQGKLTNFPQAGDMKALKWNPDLATLAQNWANQCIFEHESRVNRTLPKLEVTIGQNLFKQFSNSSQFILQKRSHIDRFSFFQKAMDLWFEEYKNFTIEEQLNPYKPKPKTGHFSAMIWAQTDQIGCGMTEMSNKEKFEIIIACDYGPGGNIEGQPVYQNATPCSLCSNDNCTDGLCSEVQM